MKYEAINYSDYLKIDQLLSCQQMKSSNYGKPAHDEMLFITIHQVYELWFKQILHEVGSIVNLLSDNQVDESEMGTVVARLERVTEIQRLLIDQINVLETMTPLDFLDFRDMLFPASGFQSYQFRVFEVMMGLSESDRLIYNHLPYHAHFSQEQADKLKKLQNGPSLFSCIESWLERTPFLKLGDFDFWTQYKEAVARMFASEKDLVDRNTMLSNDDKQRNFKIMEQSKNTFSAIFDETEYEKLRQEGHWRLSHKSLHAALLIQLYRDQPIFQLPFKLLTALMNVDELLTTWRYRHALMAKRMLGTKIGTGGSSGFKYLRDSTEKHKVFSDFFQLTTFFIPRSELPELPPEAQKALGFQYKS